MKQTKEKKSGFGEKKAHQKLNEPRNRREEKNRSMVKCKKCEQKMVSQGERKIARHIYTIYMHISYIFTANEHRSTIQNLNVIHTKSPIKAQIHAHQTVDALQ